MSTVGDTGLFDIPATTGEVVRCYSVPLTVSMAPLDTGQLPDGLVTKLKEQYRADFNASTPHMNLRYCGEHSLSMTPGKTYRVDTGVTVNLPTRLTDRIGVITPHPGLAPLGLSLAMPFQFHPRDDRTQIQISLRNLNTHYNTTIHPGDVIAQYTLIGHSGLNLTENKEE